MTLKKTFVALVALHLAVLIACNKEKSFESKQQIEVPDDGNDVNADFGWAFTGNSTGLSGCIDTAYTETNQGAAILTIEGTDSLDNAFLIAVGSHTGNLATGTFTETTGAGMIVTDKDGNSYVSKTFSIKITNISNNEVSAEFSGGFSDDPAANNTVYTITGGKLKAVLGGDTPCL